MLKAILYDKDGTLMRFDEFWVPVARNAIKQIIKKAISVADSGLCANGDFYEKVSPLLFKIERKIGIYGNVSLPDGILCRGTYASFAEAITNELKEFGVGFVVSERDVREAIAENMGFGKILPTSENLRESLLKAKKHAALYVVTTDDPSITKICLDKLNVSDLFDGIFCDDGIIPYKPDPYSANLIINEHKAEKGEVYMIGDTITDEAFAKNAGINFVYVGNDERFSKRVVFKADSAGCATDLILKIESAKRD